MGDLMQNREPLALRGVPAIDHDDHSFAKLKHLACFIIAKAIENL
jgi:hypothetical protein